MTTCTELASNGCGCRVLVDVVEATAAAAAATAATVATAQCWNHSAAIEASAEGSTAAPASLHYVAREVRASLVGTSCSAGWTREEATPFLRSRPHAWLLREPGAGVSLLPVTALPSSLPECNARVHDEKPDRDRWNTGQMTQSHERMELASGLCAKACLRFLSTMWRAWHLQAVARGQILRRQLRHARGVWRCRLFRGWREAVSTGTSLATGGTSRFQQRRAARFVQGSMVRLHAARLLHQCKARWVRDTTRLLVASWRLACALTLLTQRVFARDCTALLRWAFYCFLTVTRQTAAVRHLTQQRQSLVLDSSFKVLQRKMQVGREAARRAAACESSLLHRCVQTWHLRTQCVAATRCLAGRRDARMLRATLLALHVCVQLVTSVRYLRARRALIAVRACFISLQEWAEMAATVRCLTARHNRFLLRAALKVFSKRMRIVAAAKALQVRCDAVFCRAAFGILHKHVQIEIALKFFVAKRMDRVLYLVFQAHRAWTREALAMKSVMHNASLSISRLRRGASLQILRAHMHEAQRRRSSEAAVKISVAQRKRRHAIAALHRESVVTLGLLDISIARACRRKRSVYRTLLHSVVMARKAQDVALKHASRSAQSVINRWLLAARTLHCMRELPAASALAARCCIAWWIYDCPLPAILLTWRLSVAFVQREYRATQLAGRAAARSARVLLGVWAALASSPKQLRWRLEWQRTLRSASAVLRAWHRRLQVVSMARASCDQCRCRLVLWSWQHWQAAVLACRVERQLQAAAFRSWHVRAEECQQARDETLRGRWLDEAAAAFITRRLVRSLMNGFTAWGLHALCIHGLRARVSAHRRRHLSVSVIHTLWLNSALARISAVSNIVDGVLARRALQQWRLTNAASAVAAACQHRRISRAWCGLRATISRRRASVSLAKVVSEHLNAWAYRRLASHMYDAVAAECHAVSHLARRRAEAVFTLWFSTWRAQRLADARREALPIVLRAWRRVCNEHCFRRRRELRAGMRAWRSHARGRWADRRRLAVAELLAARRLLRCALLPWQLICFAETPSHALLLQRWSDAVADPGVLRPLVALRASNLPEMHGSPGVTAAAKACTVRDGRA